VFSANVAAVFLGTVDSIEPPYNVFTGAPWTSPTPFETEVTLSVQEAFKGVDSKKVLVRTPDVGMNCGFPFKKGEQYLVYAYKLDDQLHTTICNRTRPAGSATEDLGYLRKMRNLPDISEVFGTYKRYTYYPNFVPKPYSDMAPMVGETATITAESGTALTTKVDAEGRFSFTGLTPGKYAIKVSVPARMAQPDGWVAGQPRFSTNSLTVLPKGCAEVTFTTWPDGHIAGRIVSVEGLPLANVEVCARDTRKIFEPYLCDESAHTASDGTFDVGSLPPGKYVLSAYVSTLPQGRPTWDDWNRLMKATLRYFPGTSEFDLAKPIVVDFGQHIPDITLAIPFSPDAWKDVKIAPGTETMVKKN
jgi:hypothetical protein